MSIDEIQIVSPMEHVRRRPTMYLGPFLEADNINILAREASCIGLDEALDGNCDRIDISMDELGFVTVSQNGDGLSMKIIDNEITQAESLLTSLYTCQEMKKHKDARSV